MCTVLGGVREGTSENFIISLSECLYESGARVMAYLYELILNDAASK